MLHLTFSPLSGLVINKADGKRGVGEDSQNESESVLEKKKCQVLRLRDNNGLYFHSCC